MKKLLSILLSVLLLLSTMAVLTILPAVATTTENEPVNLIVNGDGSMKTWGDNKDENGNAYTTITDTTNPNFGLIVQSNFYGWRSMNYGTKTTTDPETSETTTTYTPYANCSIRWTKTPNVPDLYYAGYTTDTNGISLQVNNGNASMQDIKIEKDKTYTVSFDATFYPKASSAAVTGLWFDAHIDDGAGEFMCDKWPGTGSTENKYVAVTGKSYDLCDQNDDVYNEMVVDTTTKAYDTYSYTKSDGTTVTNWDFGGFKNYTFTFAANDVINDFSMTDDDSDGYYDARFVIKNNCSTILLFDNVTIYESHNIISSDGGYVNTEFAYANTTSTIVATPYYGNNFKGWYNGDTLVSTSATYTGVITSDLTAKFDVYNQIVDGSFESGTDAGITQFTEAKRYSTIAISPTLVSPTETPAATHGNYCLEINPGDTTNAASKQLFNLPVTISKDTEYYFEYYVYCVPSTYTDSAGTEVTNNYFNSYFCPIVGTSLSSWNTSSLNLFKSYTYTFFNENGKKNNTNVYSWNGTVQAAKTMLTVDTRMVSINQQWVCVRLLFNSGNSEDIFGTDTTATLNLQIGVENAINADIRLDNIFFGESTQNANMTATAGGTVSTATTVPMHYKSTAYGSLPSETDYTVSYYPAKANEYTATADTGYRFVGWYDGDTLVSSNATEIFYSGKNYTAKFEPVPTYTITATAEKNADGIYGGYVINKSQVINEAENVTVNAVTYAGNTFEGWYNGETKVSSNESYTFTVASDVDLVAKWNVENLWPDSGYENTEIGLEQMIHHNINGQWKAKGNFAYWSHAKAVTDRVNSGSASLFLQHRNNEVGTEVSVTPNTDYEFSLNWRIYPTDSRFSQISVYSENGSKIAYFDINTPYSTDFQNTKVVFNSGNNDKIFIAFTYTAGSPGIWLDDIVLVPFTGEDTGYYRVTYDFGDSNMVNAIEYVKGGEYTLRAHTFFERSTVMKDFVNYTVGSENKVPGDVITVEGDITVTINYKDHVSSDLTDNTTFDPANYEFTFAALPDPQKLLLHHGDYYGKIGEWLIANKEAYKIAGVMALGDLTEHGSWTQFSASYDAFKDVIKAMPFGVSLGNHDYMGGGGTGNYTATQGPEYNTLYNHFFKDDIVESLLANNGGAYPYVNKAIEGYEVMSADADIDDVTNTYYVYDNGYIVISLEIYPRTEILNWANAIAKANPEKKVIVTTHSHLGDNGELLNDDDLYYIAANETTNSGTTVRETLLETNSNIVMMVCGHDSTQQIVYDEHTREDGSIYYEVLIDNQDDDENYRGVGMVALLGFRADGTIDTTYYSTIWNKYFKSDVNEVTFDFGITSHSDVAENVTEGEAIDTSVVDNDRYFIPYGALYYTDENGDIKYVDKDADGKFTAPVTGTFNFTGFKKPAFGKLLTFGASANPTDGTVQYGSYIESVTEGTQYGTMFITGDWDAFVKYYQDNKSWTVDEIVAKVSAMYDNKIANYDGYVPISAGEDIAIFVYKVDQKNWMYKNDGGVLEFALRVVGLEANQNCTAVAYAKTESGCEFSENVISTSFNKLVGAN